MYALPIVVLLASLVQGLPHQSTPRQSNPNPSFTICQDGRGCLLDLEFKGVQAKEWVFDSFNGSSPPVETLTKIMSRGNLCWDTSTLDSGILPACVGNSTQLFNIQSQVDGSFTLQGTLNGNGTCLSHSSFSRGHGINLIVAGACNAANARWHITEVLPKVGSTRSQV